MAKRTLTTADYPLRPIAPGQTVENFFEAAAVMREATKITQISEDDGAGDEGKLAVRLDACLGRGERPILADRYEVRRRIDAGGMGIVYEAFDHVRAIPVALKTLRRMSPQSIFRFKEEFRGVHGVVHRNLIVVYELWTREDEWFFTMEHLDGEDFFRHVRGPRRSGLVGDTRIVSPTEISEAETEDVSTSHASEPAAKAAPGFDEGRLRTVLLQLVEGVKALHDAGKIHRDLNTGNAFVTSEGRVVVLDFGLIGDDDGGRRRPGSFDVLSGTPEYMSPEQARGLKATPASDWYAVGVMLYEALTGRLPFVGPHSKVLAEKQIAEPPPPASLVAGVPEDLAALCVRLLRRAPDERPRCDEILAILGAPAPPAAIAGPAFLGREAERAALREAYADALRPRAQALPWPVTVGVRGPSGTGKTALVRCFLDELEAGGEALVLRGRCYERESVPYKAFDALVDALTQHLRGLPEDAARALLPPDIHALARIFPVLLGARAVEEAPRGRFEAPDSLEVRRRAFRCLRELLERLAAERPLVVALDDLQWGDLDSARLLATLLAPPGDEGAPHRAPRFLLVGAYRGDEHHASPLLDALSDLAQRGAIRFDTRSIELGPLLREDAIALARARMTREGRADAEAIAEEAGCCPLFVEQLARAAHASPGRGRATLAELVEARLAELPGVARRLLETIAVAGRPVSQSLALRIAAPGKDGHVAMLALLSGRLVRARGAGSAVQVEIEHDRLREAVVASMAADVLAACHARLADALGEGGGPADPEVLAAHLEGAGRLAEAAARAAEAADRAAGALAFDRAAELYARAIALGGRAQPPWTRPARAPTARAREDLLERRADALVDADRAAEAAPLYLACAHGVAPLAALDLQRRAAEQLLVSGHVGEGVRVLRPVLAALGIDYPAGDRLAFAALVARLGRLTLAGTRERAPSRPATPEDRVRIDACWSAARGLAASDLLRSGGFLALAVLLALRAGDARRHVAPGLAMLGCLWITVGGPRQIARGTRLLEDAERIAERDGDPYLRAVASASTGAAWLSLGRAREALGPLDRAAALLADQCAGARWERGACRRLAMRALLAQGELGEYARRAHAREREVGVRDNLLGGVESALDLATVRLAEGAPAIARAEMRAAIARAVGAGLHAHEGRAAALEARCDLYEGRADLALAGATRTARALEAAHLTRIQLLRVKAWELRGVAAVAAGSYRLAEADAARLDGEDHPVARAAAAMIRAGAAHLAGQPRRELEHLREAAARYDDASMKIHAACCLLREGALLAGAAGRALAAEAEATLRAEEIRDPARWTAMYTGLRG